MAHVTPKFLNASSGRLSVRDLDDGWRPATGEEIVIAARAALARRVRRGTVISSPHIARDFLIAKLSPLDYEVFSAMFLDARHRLIEYRELFRGTIDGATVHPREVAKEALAFNAAAIIFAHNHPSGVAEPSEADRSITLKLSKALSLLDVRVLDHVVVAGARMISLAERGFL
jgi:DNA repair protein RadC